MNEELLEVKQKLSEGLSCVDQMLEGDEKNKSLLAIKYNLTTALKYVEKLED